MDSGTKFSVLDDDTEMVNTFDSKLCHFLDFCLLMLWITKFLF